MGLAALFGGIILFAAIRILHPHFITEDTLSNEETIRIHIDLWLRLGAGCAGISLTGLILWIVAGTIDRRKKKQLTEPEN